MNKYYALFASCSLLFMSFNSACEEDFEFQTNSFWSDVIHDYENFYQSERLYRAAGAFSVGAVMANTNIDPQFQDWHQSNIQSDASDELSKVVKVFGEKFVMLPVALLASSLQLSSTNNAFGEWGQLTLRSYLVSSPAVGALQFLTGGSRPRDTDHAEWRPFNDDNGVSGHAYVGAVPFLVLAQMDQLTDVQKNIAFVASGLTAWSRVNDDAHYLSQSLLGWYLAWEAVDAVTSTGVKNNWYKVSPYAFGDGVGVSVSMTW